LPLAAISATLTESGESRPAIGRALGCTTGRASKWRVRYAKNRLAGFSEVGDRGAEAKYGKETDRRILTLLDAAPPKGYANWTGPLIAKARSGGCLSRKLRAARALLRALPIGCVIS